MKLRLSEPRPHRHCPDPRTRGASVRRTGRVGDRRWHRAHDRHVGVAAREVPGSGRKPRRESAIHRCATAARWAAASRTRDPFPADDPAVILAGRRGDSSQGTEGMARGEARRLLSVSLFTVDMAPDEIIVGVQFAPVKAAAYGPLCIDRLAFRDRRVAVCARRKRRRDPVGEVGLWTEPVARHSADRCSNRRSRKGLTRRPSRRRPSWGGWASRCHSDFRRQRGLSSRDDSGVHATGPLAAEIARSLDSMPSPFGRVFTPACRACRPAPSCASKKP